MSAPQSPAPVSGARADMPTEIWAEIVRDDDGQWAAFASTVERPTWQRFVRVDLASQPPAETGWRGIESAPKGVDVLLFCPERGIANRERIELGMADNGRGSHHSWATHWMPLPSPPVKGGEE